MPKSLLKCPFCSKTSSHGAGLASHIRSAHPEEHASAGSPFEAPVRPNAPDPSPVTLATSLIKGGADSTRDLLGKAYAQLTQRKRVIEEQLSRFDDLKIELETIDAQVESLKGTVTLFGITEQPAGSPESGEAAVLELEAPVATSADAEGLEFTGNKRDFVTAIVKSRGSEGITPREIERIFSDRKIEKGRNLIYNALSLLVKQGRMKRDGGRYTIAGARQSAVHKTRGAGKREKAPSASTARRSGGLTPEGRQKLAEAMKKRWAAKRAAAQTRRGPGRPRKVVA